MINNKQLFLGLSLFTSSLFSMEKPVLKGALAFTNTTHNVVNLNVTSNVTGKDAASGTSYAGNLVNVRAQIAPGNTGSIASPLCDAWGPTIFVYLYYVGKNPSENKETICKTGNYKIQERSGKLYLDKAAE